MGDSLGDRMKRYEACSQYLLPPNSFVAVRVDGRAFHTYTKGMNKPFDTTLMEAMVASAKCTMEEIGGSCKLAYTQSDETTFILTDADAPQTQPWMANNHSKLVSVIASIYTALFNFYMFDKVGQIATFDARAFCVPRMELANLLLWRHQDWNRNSLQMYARSVYSHRELHRAGKAQLHDLLKEKDMSWAVDLSPAEKDGTYVLPNSIVYLNDPSYNSINALIDQALAPRQSDVAILEAMVAA